MKDILQVLFEANEYTLHFHNKDFLVFKHASYDDFWVVLDYKEDLVEKQSIFFSLIIDQVLRAYKTAEKNISMIIPMKVDAFTDYTKQVIIDLEDDPFYFKKFVIPYTDKDIQEVLQILDPINIVDTIMDRQSFSSLKCEMEDYNQRVGAYHLLYSFVHKLPFLMMNVTPKSSDTLVNHFVPKDEKQQEIYEWASNVNPEYIEQEMIDKYIKHID